MRISDWSSDVCSSDLSGVGLPRERGGAGRRRRLRAVARSASGEHKRRHDTERARAHFVSGLTERSTPPFSSRKSIDALPSGARSEEHTSELQSLMRISYAVFGLKKKKTKTTTPKQLQN